MEERGVWSRQKLRDAIAFVKWEEYEAGCKGGRLKTLLLELFSDDPQDALEASCALWNELCHQAQTVPAALPAYEILLAGIQVLNDDLKVEVMDILYNVIGGIPETEGMPAWKRELREKFERDRRIYKELTASLNEDAAAFAELILEQM